MANAKAMRRKLQPQATKVSFPRPGRFQVDLADGRTLTVPTDWFPRLVRATPEQLCHVEIEAGGAGLRWPEVDEDIPVEGLLATDEIVVLPDVDARIAPAPHPAR